ENKLFGTLNTVITDSPFVKLDKYVCNDYILTEQIIPSIKGMKKFKRFECIDNELYSIDIFECIDNFKLPFDKENTIFKIDIENKLHVTQTSFFLIYIPNEGKFYRTVKTGTLSEN